jgi:hypothetical protein
VARSGRVGRIRHLLLALAVLPALAAAGACDGKSIHLGDGWLDGGACPHRQVTANEVLWIGDSWILVTGSQHTRVAALARGAGAIGPTDDYAIGAAAAAPLTAIVNQYAAREAGAIKVKVVIMDGGTWDTIVANASESSVNGVVNTFGQFLTQVASDGTVQHIVYFLPPELPLIPGVAPLRPLLQQACGASTVPCHFIDLQQQIWSAHPEYTDANLGFLPTDAGSQAVADAIWAVMQQNCIAQ